MFSLTSRSAKRDVVRQNLDSLTETPFDKERFATNQRSTTSGPLCDFYKSGDLDHDIHPIFAQKKCHGSRIRIHQMSKKSGRLDQYRGMHIVQ